MGVYYWGMKTRENNNKFIYLGIFLVLLILVIFKFFTKQKPAQLVSTNDQKIQRIKELSEASLSSAGYPDEKTANETRKEICQLTARPQAEQDKALAAVRNFLDQPAAEVIYQCSDAFYDTTNNILVSAHSETYRVGLSTFLVNPQTNHVMQANIQDFAPSIKIFTANEIETLTKEFVTKHEVALGVINLNSYSHESNQKGSKEVNYFFTWKGKKQTVTLDSPAVTCSKDITKNTKGIFYQADGTPCYKTYEQVRQPIIQMAYNNHGQLLNFANTFEDDIGREITF